MRVLELAPQVYVSGQVFEDDLKLAAKQNVRSIVNNRPDDETVGQPKSADLARVAEELGMTFVHFPLESRSISQAVRRGVRQGLRRARTTAPDILRLRRSLDKNMGNGRVNDTVRAPSRRWPSP